MSRHTLFSALALTASTLVYAQTTVTTALVPLASKSFAFSDLPYQVTGDQGGVRGPQFGYNLCNSTTEGQSSLCQTMLVNTLADFCMWSSSQPNDNIGASEQREVAWCTRPGHGTRIIPPGAISGAQWLYAKNYIQVVGFIDQSQINLAPNDTGGELDDYGADEQGNPLGAMVYTNAFGVNSQQFQSMVGANNFTGSTNYQLNNFWIDFIGSGMFCIKLCNPDDPAAAQLCNHVYDEIGCSYNALANYGSINGSFTACDSDDMAPPGIFTTDGALTTWFQPLNGPLGTVPYTPVLQSTSNCVTYASTELFAAAATDTAVFSGVSGAAPTATGNTSGGANHGTTSRTGSGSAATQTGTSGAPLSTGAVPFVAVGLLTTLVTMVAFLA